jgi:hypothetical protein
MTEAPIADSSMSSVMRHRLQLITAALLLSVLSREGQAQSTTQGTRPPNATNCSLMATVVAVQVVDTAGVPVGRATIAMTRLRDSASLGTAGEMGAGSGQYALLESSALQWIAPAGDRIRLTISAGARAMTTVIVVGRDASGCGITMRSGPQRIVFR